MVSIVRYHVNIKNFSLQNLKVLELFTSFVQDSGV